MLQWDEIYKKDPTTYKYYDLLQPHEDMPRIAALLKKRKATRVLDLGCGSGRNLFFLDKLGFDVAGIDIAPAGIKTIKDRIKGVDAKVGDIYTRLPYPDASFDDRISYRRWSGGEERDEWRRNNITSFVEQSYHSVKFLSHRGSKSAPLR